MEPTRNISAHVREEAEPPVNEDLVALGEKLRRYRTTRLDATLNHVATLTDTLGGGKGVSAQAIGRIEAGSHQYRGGQSQPSMHTLLLLAEAYRLGDSERDEILTLAGYDPDRIPQLPRGDLWDLPDEQLYELGGRIKAILEHRRREQER